MNTDVTTESANKIVPFDDAIIMPPGTYFESSGAVFIKLNNDTSGSVENALNLETGTMHIISVPQNVTHISEIKLIY